MAKSIPVLEGVTASRQIPLQVRIPTHGDRSITFMPITQ